MSAAIEFQGVDILFARQPGRAGRASMREALAALDAGATRGDIQSKFGVIVGVAGANLSVARGEISVLMGLSGSGKSTLLRAANGLNPVTRGHVQIRDGESAIDVATCGTAQLRRVRRELDPKIALIGFCGAPWTLATYIVEGAGSKSFVEIKTLMHREPKVLEALLAKNTEGRFLGLYGESRVNVLVLNLGIDTRLGHPQIAPTPTATPAPTSAPAASASRVPLQAP